MTHLTIYIPLFKVFPHFELICLYNWLGFVKSSYKQLHHVLPNPVKIRKIIIKRVLALYLYNGTSYLLLPILLSIYGQMLFQRHIIVVRSDGRFIVIVIYLIIMTVEYKCFM